MTSAVKSETGRKLLTGSAMIVLNSVASFATVLIVTPVVIRALGQEDYGLWVIIGTVVSYFAFLDIGLTGATRRFVAFYLARNAPAKVNYVFRVSFGFYLTIYAVSLLLLALVLFSVPAFSDDPDRTGSVRTALLLLGITATARLPGAVLLSLLVAKLRYAELNVISMYAVVTKGILVYYFASHGYGIVALAWVTAVIDLSVIGGWILLTRREYPFLNYSAAFRFSRGKAREIIRFSGVNLVVVLGNLLRSRVDVLVIAAFTGNASVAVYNIALRLVDMGWSVLMQLVDTAAPIITAHVSTGDRPGLKDRFLSVSTIALVVTSLVFGAAIVVGDQFIALWVGDDFSGAYVPLVLLCVASGLSILQVPGEQVCYAYARHHRLALLVLSEGLLNVGMSVALAPSFGILGVAAATLLASVIHRGVLLPLYVLRLIEIDLRQYLLTLLPVFVLSIGAQSTLYAAALYVRFGSLIELMLVTGLVYSCLGLMLIRFGLSRRDREILTTVAPFARKLLL